MQDAFEQLRSRASDLHHLTKVAMLLNWDQRTMMPPGGAPARGDQLAAITRAAHDVLASSES